MRLEVILKKFSKGITLIIIALTFIYFLLSEGMPDYANDSAMMKYSNASNTLNDINDNEITQESGELIELIGIDDIVFSEPQAESQAPPTTNPNSEKLKGLEYLQKNYYIVDKKTGMSSDYFDINKFNSVNLKLENKDNGPKVLVFHTHSHEMFADSKPNDKNEGIVGAGTRLCNNLEKKGIKTIHITDSFDIVNGKTQIYGAYERMEPKITEVLKKYPSIEMVIDMHRDGVNENTHLVTNINGKPTAQIMFFNGICRLISNGKLNELSDLKNPYIPTNLALSFSLKRTGDELYPSLCRKIYLNAYRYSLHMRPKSTLIEVGAQTNTKQEIYNAIDCLSEIIYKVVA